MAVIESSPKILGGRPCAAGTRVPMEALFHHLRGGSTVSDFLHEFPAVTQEQVERVLEMANAWIPGGEERAAG